MSALMENLLAAQRKLEADPAYIAPSVAAEDRAAAAGFVSLETPAILRERVKAAEQRAMEQERVITEMARVIGAQRAQLRQYSGKDLIPRAGHQIAPIRVGQAEVLVEFEYSPAWPASEDDPGEPEVLAPVSVLINGALVHIDDLLEAMQDDSLIDAIQRHIKAVREDSAVSAYLAQEG